MVRLLGAVLVAGGAAWAGLSAAEGLKRRVRALDALVDGLSLLEQELELDSLDTVDLMMSFEDEFGIQMEMSEDMKTVGDVVKAIEEQVGE